MNESDKKQLDHKGYLKQQLKAGEYPDWYDKKSELCHESGFDISDEGFLWTCYRFKDRVSFLDYMRANTENFTEDAKRELIITDNEVYYRRDVIVDTDYFDALDKLGEDFTPSGRTYRFYDTQPHYYIREGAQRLPISKAMLYVKR